MMMTIITLFIVVVSVTALLFEELDDRVESILGSAMDDSRFSTDLESWKRHHRLVCHVVDSINKTFGLIVLILLGHVIMEWTILTGKIIFSILLHGIFKKDLAMIFLEYFFLLLVLVLPSWNLRTKVSKAMKQSELKKREKTYSLFLG